jgi:restriction system protein
MAEITKKRQGEMLRAVFGVLVDAPEGLPAKEILAKAASVLVLTDYEKGAYSSTPDSTRFEKIVRFSTIWPVKAGWMLKSKGRWQLTEDGRKAYAKYADPEIFAREALRLYQVWDREKPEATPEEIVRSESVEANITLERAEGAAWDEVQRFLQGIHPYALQDLVAALLKAMGYHVVWNAPPGKDGGVDVIAYTTPFGATGSRIKVQVKRKAEKITADGLRGFLSLVTEGHDVGIFVCTGGFTPDAIALARDEKRRVTLLNAQQLFELWTEHYSKLEESEKQLLPITRVFFLNPRE